MLGLLINILHLVLASALSLISIDYERDAGCDPVRFETVAYYPAAETRRNELRRRRLDLASSARLPDLNASKSGKKRVEMTPPAKAGSQGLTGLS